VTMDPKKLDIEPLGDSRWSRIERALFARVAHGEAEAKAVAAQAGATPRWHVAAALVMAGAMAAIGGAVGWRTWEAPHAVVITPSRVSTGVTASRLNVGEATLDVDPQSVVTVSGDDEHGIDVKLERGRVECDVPPRRGRPPFSVEAGDVVVRVVGTHFTVTRTTADVDVQVDHGVVEVTRGEERVHVHPGESWSEVAQQASTRSASSIEPASSAAPVATPSAAPAPSSSAAPPTPRETYESASRIEASHPDHAIEMYRDLAAKGGPWGMNALFAEGRLEADRGQKGDARRALEDYLSRYPSGPNADDARELLGGLR